MVFQKPFLFWTKNHLPILLEEIRGSADTIDPSMLNLTQRQEGSIL